ncbi:MAG: dual specificity protein phosphatase family protein [Paracoccaceae bacterium]|nr:dual specificity protein phosphatase family protein [Paracoccaceae bacterium]
MFATPLAQDASEPIVIHALPVGGGILALSPLPGAGGDYAADMDHIASWAPAFVVSLVTDVELVAAGARNLGADIQDKGTRWLQLPIGDFGVPDAAFETAWKDVSARLRQALQGGGRVLVHCRGGCGRSGMVALRLMIEAGDAPDEALPRLRAVRPCAIETDAQMRWAMQAERQPAVFVRHTD